MDTAYKTRAWWALLALEYALDATWRPPSPAQARVWGEQCRKAMEAATAPAGDQRLVRIYVDRQGYLLPEFVAAG